jgi:hypothetical protein
VAGLGIIMVTNRSPVLYSVPVLRTSAHPSQSGIELRPLKSLPLNPAFPHHHTYSINALNLIFLYPILFTQPVCILLLSPQINNHSRLFVRTSPFCPLFQIWLNSAIGPGIRRPDGRHLFDLINGNDEEASRCYKQSCDKYCGIRLL